jgi:hypothetical protein
LAKSIPKVKKPVYKPYEINVSDEDKKLFEKWISDRLEDALNAKSPLNLKIQTWRDLYAGKEYDRTPSFENGSNIRIPVVRILADQILLRLVQSHFGVEPYVRIKPQPDVGELDGARSLERQLWHVHKAQNKLLAGFLVIKDSVITGTGVCKTVWDMDYKLVRDKGKKKYVLKYNYPKTVHIPTEDFVIYPAKSTTVDDAQFVGHKFERRWDELQRGVATGLYNEDWMEDLRSKASGSRTATDSQDARVGVKDSGVDWKDKTYELYELIVGYDYDDDGLDEDYLVTFERSTGKIIRWIEYPASYGERWYHTYTPIPVSNSVYGESMVGLTEAFDEEISTLHNQRIDNTTLVNMPMLKVRKGSPAAKDDEKAKPGKKWLVNEPDDLTPLTLVPPLQDGFRNDEDQLLYYSKILTGVSELNMGGTVRGDKTAYEIEASLAEGSIRIRLQVTLGVEWLTRMAWQELGLLKQFLPDGVYERVTGGPNILADLAWEDMWEHYDVEPTGNTTTSNRELERQKFVFLREALKNDPLLFDADPSGVMVPKGGWYELNNRFLVAHSIDDPESIIGPKPEEAPREPMEEARPDIPPEMMGGGGAPGGMPGAAQMSGDPGEVDGLLAEVMAEAEGGVTPGAI